jgi:hypothetical protein
MVDPPSPIAGIDIRRDDALNCVSVGVDLERAEVEA